MDYIKKKQWSLAIQAFLQAVRIEPQYVEAWNNLGYATSTRTSTSEILRRLDAKMAAELLGAIEANNPDLGDD